MDAAAPVALLTTALRGSAGGSAGVVGGVLAALIALPHLTGPLIARPLAQAGDPRLVIAGAAVMFGAAIAAAGAATAAGCYAWGFAAALSAGCAGPLLTGGLSQFAIPPGLPAQPLRRRCEGWDTATYGVGSVAGPLLVGAVATVAGPSAVFGGLLGLALGGAVMTTRLPVDPRRSSAPADAPRTREAIAAIWSVDPLRRVLVATAGAALGSGGFTVVAVVLGGSLSGNTVGGALLAAAFGAGQLAGSAYVIVRPIKSEPESATLRLLVAEGSVAVAAVASPTMGLGLLLFFAIGGFAAVQFAASLAVRSTYAPARIRPHVYVTMAGIKVAFASIGAAVAGLLVAVSPRLALFVSGMLMIASAAAAGLARRRRTSDPGPGRARVNA